MATDLSAPAIDLASTPDFTVGGLAVRPSRREVESTAGPERIEPRVMQALVLLAVAPGEVVSRDTLLARCWRGQIVGDDAISRCMTKLRQLGQAHGAFTVEVVPRVGYRLALPAGAAPVRPRRRGWAAAAAMAVVVAAATAWAWWSWPSPLDADTPFSVEPFRAVSSDPAARRLAATADAELTGVLSQARLPTATGAAPRTRFVFDGVVDGDARGIHTRVRLRETATGQLLWSADLSGPAADIDILRTRIAWRSASVAQMAQDALASRSRDLDPRALALAIQAFDGVDSHSWSPLASAEALIRRAPGFASGHAMLSSMLIAAAARGPAERAPGLRARAIAEAQRALALQPDDMQVRSARMLTLDTRRWSERWAVMSGSPKSETAWGQVLRGLMMMQDGRGALGRALTAQGMEAKPAIPGHAPPLVMSTYLSGRRAEALALAEARLAVRPDEHAMREMRLDMLTLSGDPDEALAIVKDPAQRPARWSPETANAVRRFIAWRKAPGPETRSEALAAIQTGWRGRRLAITPTVLMLTALDDLDSAFAAAQAYADDRDTPYLGMFFDVLFLYADETAVMRRDPRFIPLVRSLGLLEWWRASGNWPDFCRTEPQSVCAAMKTG